MRQIPFDIQLRMGQLNMVQHNFGYETSARNARRLEKKQAKVQRVDCATNITQTTTTEKEE